MTFGDGTFGDGTFGEPVAAAWQPGDPWPGTAGGASSPTWGGYVRVWIRAGLKPGVPFHIGTHVDDRLDFGNVMAGAEVLPRSLPVGERLWVDISCDVMDCEITGGASSSAGIFSKADAATLVATLYDPDGRYDPLNVNSPYAYQGRSRLVPGTPVEAFAEVVDPNGLISGTPGDPGSPGTYGPAQRIAISGSVTHYDVNINNGIRLSFSTAGRITKLRYLRIAGSNTTLTFQVWNAAGTKIAEQSDTQAAVTGPFEFTLTTPIVVAAGDILTFSMWAGAGNAAALTPPGTVTPTANVAFVNYYNASGNVFPNTTGGRGVNIEPSFEPQLTAPVPPTPAGPDTVGLVVTRHWMFTGTADSWSEGWTPDRAERHAQLVATDVTKQWVRYDQPEQPPVGAGDTTAQRVERLVDYYGWPGTIIPGTTSHVTLQATTLAQPGWELLNRVLDDELGFVYFTVDGDLRWVDRAAWSALTAAVLELGCPHVTGSPGAYDVLIDANPAVVDAEMRNAVYASREGGTMQQAVSTSSQAEFGVYDYQRTDLGVQTDPLAGQWATDVVTLYAYPQVGLKDVTMIPALADDPALWDKVLGIKFMTDLVRFVWAPHDLPENVVDMTARIVGFSHRFSYDEWEIEWQLVGLDSRQFSEQVFQIGSVPGDSDRLDAGFVLGFV